MRDVTILVSEAKNESNKTLAVKRRRRNKIKRETLRFFCNSDVADSMQHFRGDGRVSRVVRSTRKKEHARGKPSPVSWHSGALR